MASLQRAILSLVLLATLPAMAAAQAPGALRVTVLDPSGLVIHGAAVAIVEAGAQARTDASGLAVFEGLAEGRYTVRVQADHLSDVEQRDVPVAAGQITAVAVPFVALRSRETQVDVVGEAREHLRAIPGSVDLISREELVRSRTFDANEVLRRIPGVVVREEAGPAAMRLSIGIRGLNPDRSRQVLVLEDGLPLALAPYGEPEMYYSPPIERMQRIEVLKGSGSILFGPQTIGGVVNFVTPDPPLRQRADIDVTAGQRELFVGRGTWGATYGRLGLFAGALRKQGDGFRRFEFDINDLSTKLTWQLTDRQSLAFKANYYDEISNSTYLGLTQPQYDADPNDNAVPGDELDVRRVFGSLHHRVVFNDRTFLTTTAFAYDTTRFWRRQNFDRAPAAGRTYAGVSGDPTVPGGAVYLRTDALSRDREFRVAGVETRLMRDHRAFGVRQAFEGGGRFLYERAIDQQVNTDLVGGARVMRDDERRPAHAWSAFAQNRLFLGDRVTVTPGVRVEHYAFTRHILLAPVGGVPTARDIKTSDVVSEVVPGLGATWSAHANVTVFAGAHRGFAPPRVKDAITAAGVSLELDAERSWNYEVGTRWTPRGGIHADATFFVLDFSNQIIPGALSGGATTTLVNAGLTLHRGVEMSTGVDFARLTGRDRGLSADIRYTWLPTARFESGVLTGNRLPYAPEHVTSLLLAWRDARGLTLQADGTFLSDQFGDDHNRTTGTVDGTVGPVPAYGLWNLSASYELRSGQRRIAPFVTVKNAANRIYIASRAPQGIQPGPFRQVNVGVSIGF
ncbi:MAG: TonB-dependent receptor [Vicinamibacterales bacterium]|nr:TonB-dependent receptor [Vicinamibacterales bacterium]